MIKIGSAQSVMVVFVIKDMANQVQTLDQVFCISHSVNTFGKRHESNYFPPAMDKKLDRLFNLEMETGVQKENSDFKLVNVR